MGGSGPQDPYRSPPLFDHQHVRDIVRNFNFRPRALRHIRSSLTSDVANTIAWSIIGSRLDYCNSLLVGISEQNLDSIQRVQSKAARIVCNAARHSPSSDLLHSIHWLPVRHRIEFKTATLCFKAVKLGTPSYLNNMLKRMHHCELCAHPTWIY